MINCLNDYHLTEQDTDAMTEMKTGSSEREPCPLRETLARHCRSLFRYREKGHKVLAPCIKEFGGILTRTDTWLLVAEALVVGLRENLFDDFRLQLDIID